MPVRPFRFLHAGEFHLDRPLVGLPLVPDHLRDALIDAPLQAAAAVFEAAVSDEVEFVLLAGGIVNAADADARSITFLLDQFELLAESRIPVYWLDESGRERAAWPRDVELPSNVHLLADSRVEEIRHERDGQPLAAILAQTGSIRPADFRPSDSELFSIGLAYGAIEPEQLEDAAVNYWALGGLASRKTICNSPATAHYAGGPQGRSPKQPGAHGATQVRVEETGRVRTRLIATDTVRWCRESVAVTGATTLEALREQIGRRAAELADGERNLLVDWQIVGDGRLTAKLRSAAGDELLHALRQEFGLGTPAVWSVSLSSAPPGALPASLYEEDTILGDFLRAAADREGDDAEPLNLEVFLSGAKRPEELAEVAELSHAAARRVLREAQRLAADLLQGSQETQP